MDLPKFSIDNVYLLWLCNLVRGKNLEGGAEEGVVGEEVAGVGGGREVAGEGVAGVASVVAQLELNDWPAIVDGAVDVVKDTVDTADITVVSIITPIPTYSIILTDTEADTDTAPPTEADTEADTDTHTDTTMIMSRMTTAFPHHLHIRKPRWWRKNRMGHHPSSRGSSPVLKIDRFSIF